MSNASGLSAGRPSARTGVPIKSLRDLADEQKPVRVNFDLMKDKHTALKVYAANHGTTITALLTEFVDTLIK